jgi:hypothetical protein
MRKLLFFFFILPTSVFAQLKINEVLLKASDGITDEYSEHSDWIELYNTSSETVELAGYKITDDPLDLNKWSIEEGEIAAGEHMIIFATGRDIRDFQAPPVATEEIIPGIGWDYGDENNDPPGNSYVEHYDFDNSIWGTFGGKPGVSAILHWENNSVIGYSYVGFHVKLETWNVAVDRSEYNLLVVEAEIQEGQSFNIQFDQTGLDPWNNYTFTLVGTGERTTYKLPLGNTAPMDLSALKGANIFPSGAWGAYPIRLYNFGFAHSGNYLHTNFSLANEGEFLLLINPDGEMIDTVTVPSLPNDHSFGAQPDGSANEVIFASPTPGATNNDANSFDDFCRDEISFSIPAGLYEDAQVLELTGSSEIRYTIDGSTPSDTSILYTSPINIDTTTVIKATCINGTAPGIASTTNTYVIDGNHDLPIFSLSTNPDYFFDWDEGIYVLGPNADSEVPHWGANFHEDWARPLYVEYFEKNGSRVIDQEVDVEIFGNYSRYLPMKSLKLKAMAKYPKKRLNHQFFDHKDIDEFKHVILRNSGGDFNNTMILDAANHMVLEDKTNIDFQAYQPAVVYLNGRYWGIHNLRERMSEHYIKENHGYDEEDIELWEGWGEPRVGVSSFWSIRDQITSTDMSVYENYKSWSDSFDLANYLDFWSAQIYIHNWDIPHGNIRMWRPKIDSRQIRLMYYDTDISHGVYDLQDAEVNQLQRIIDHESVLGEIFGQFMDSDTFEIAFVNRYADLMNTIFTTEHFHATFDRLSATIASEIPRHFDRWEGDGQGWQFRIDETKDFIAARPEYARNEIIESTRAIDSVYLSLQIEPASAGKINLNSIIPETYPWGGFYFSNIPVDLKPVANLGYEFDHWELSTEQSDLTSKSLNYDFLESATVKVVFKERIEPYEITFSEINYHPGPALNTEDWIEIVNTGNSSVNLTGWKLSDGDDVFAITENVELEANGHLVFATNLNLFSSTYPWIDNVVGPLGFSLSNKSETITLLSPGNDTIVSVTYHDGSENLDWSSLADGIGYTLELSDYELDVNDGNSWFTGCEGGSPGLAYNEACEVGIEEETNIEWVVFPNPAQTQLTINASVSIIKSRLLDLRGQEILRFNSSIGLNSLPSDLLPGMYLVEIETIDGVRLSKKILID